MQQFAKELHKTIRDSYDLSSLEKAVYLRLGQRLDQIVSTGRDFDTVVFHLLLWADSNGRLVDLAQAAAEWRPMRSDLAALARQMEAFAATKATRATETVQAVGAIVPQEDAVIPAELVSLIHAYERIRIVLASSQERTAIMAEMTQRMGALPLESLRLPDRFHLSDSEGERLAAIVALSKRPDSRFLRWLSERCVVERRFAGYTAAMALREAASRLQGRELASMASAVSAAIERLVEINDNRDRDILQAAREAAAILARRT